MILLSLIEISLDLDSKFVERETNFVSWILHHLAFHMQKHKRTDEEYFIHIFVSIVVFYTTITGTVNLINIPINITENKVDWNSYWGKTSAKYSRFRYDG